MSVFYSDHRISPQDRKKGIESFLRTIASRFGIRIEFSGTPSTDGKTVWLGDLDPADADFEALALGHGIHEMMHVVHTDASVVLATRNDGPLIMTLLNVFEDIRIDCIGAERFAGYRLWREELAATLLRRGRHRACCIAALSSSSAFALWLHARVLAELQYEWAQNVLGELRERLAEHLPQPLMNRLEEDALGALRLQSTNDALELARAVVSCLKHFSDNEPSESDAPIRQQSACTGPLSKPQSKRLQQKNQESTFSPTKSTLKAFLKTISQESAHLENNSNFTPAETSGIEQQSSTNWLEGADFSQVQGISASPWPLKTENPYLNRDAAEYRCAFAEVKNQTRALARRLNHLLRNEGQSDCGAGDDGQELAHDWLNRFAQKESALFSAPLPEKNISAEVALLLDRSGSMGIKTMTQAKSITAALVLALKEIEGCTIRAAVFPGPSASEKVSLAVLDDEPAAKSLERLSAIGAYGSTPIVEALQWALSSFGASRARDKLLVIITDGRFPKELAHTAEEGFARRGIELALLSIEADNPGIARNWVRIDDINEIQEAMVKLLSATRFRQALGQL